MADITINKLDKTKCAECFRDNVILDQTRVQSLESYCMNVEVDEKCVRPIAWKIFLDILPRDGTPASWIDDIQKMRTDYKRKKNSYFKMKKFSGDPLGGGLGISTGKKKNPEWNTLHEENEMKELINKDLNRTYQDIDLFLNVNNKNLLANILFIWAKENSDVSYKQGMNELLAVFYLAFYPYYFKSTSKPKPHKNDISHYMNSNNEFNSHLEDIYVFFHDEEELEADLYYIFCNLMKKGIKDLFDPRTMEKSSSDYKQFELFPDQWKDESDEDVPNHINRRCALLVKEKMKRLDEELFSHFKRIELGCSVFLQRWLRCIFGREFEYQQVLVLWDAVFASESPHNKYPLLFMDYIALAMLFRLRKDLLLSEQNECFSTLFHYPKIDKISELVDIAKKVRDAMIDQLKGGNTLVYEIMFIPRPLSANNISPHTYNQIPNKYSEEEQQQEAPQEVQQTGSGFLGNALSSLGNIGGMIKEGAKIVSSKVSEQIDKIKTENNFGNVITNISNMVTKNEDENADQAPEENYTEEPLDSGNGGEMNPRYIVEKLQHISSRYGHYMDKADRDDFKAIVDFLTNNVNNAA